MEWIKENNRRILLASQSPRRRELLEQLGLDFEIVSKNGVDESYPDDIEVKSVARYLAEKKAKAYDDFIDDDSILITADTIVVIENEILGKPIDKADAVRMLKLLSGKNHLVITGVALSSSERKYSFDVETKVFFKELTQEEIEYYVSTYKPYDKAGAYGIQEWIGLTGIHKIEGSYFNVVGLPVQRLYSELLKF